MDRLSQLRGVAGGSRDSTLDSSAGASEGYVTANDSSKFFSLSEADSSFDISPIKDVSLSSAAAPEKTITGNDQLISNLSPIPKKNDLLDSYKFGNEIEAANILSGGVDIFDDNDNSYDGDELVIDDNVVEIDEKDNSELKLLENSELPFQKGEDMEESQDSEQAIASKDTEVVLQIDGKNVNAIDIGNGLYLYRKAGEEELAAVQIVDDHQPQPTFKFLKVRENAEGNLEVYEEIEVEVPKEVPIKEGKLPENNVALLPINKVTNDPASSKVTETKKLPQDQAMPTISTTDSEDLNKVTNTDTKSEINLNGKMVKFNETRKSPVIHSTPNKEGIPLTKTMVDLQLHPNRHLDNVKTIEVHTDSSKQKMCDSQLKNKDTPIDENRFEVSTGNEKEIPPENIKEQPSTDIDLPTQDINFVDDKNKVEESVIENVSKTEPQTVENEQENIKIAEEIKSSEMVVTTKDAKNLESVLEENEKKEIKTSKDDEQAKPEISNEGKDNTLKTSDENNTEKTSKTAGDINVPENSRIAVSKETNKHDITDIQNKETQQHDKKQQSAKPLLTSVCVKNDTTSSSSQETNKCKKEVNTKLVDSPKSPKKLNKVEMETDNIINSEDNKSSKDVVLQDKEEHKTGPTVLDIKQSINIIKEKVEISGKDSLQNIKSEILIADEVSKDNHLNPEQISVKIDATEAFSKKERESEKIPHVSTNTTEVSVAEMKPCKIDEKPPNVTNDKLRQNIQDVATTPAAEDLTISTKLNQTAALKRDIQKAHSNLIKSSSLGTEVAERIQNTIPKKPEVKKELTRILNTEQKPINNNHAAVPFGKWTEANRQDFLNKIKETKVPTITSNTKSLKQANDLNRRDVLQKIDSQRQSNSASSKVQDQPKSNVKNETVTFVNKSRETNVPVKSEIPILKSKPILPKKSAKHDLPQMPQKVHPINSSVNITVVAKPENPQRKEINNQDLIDKTIEGIINRAVTSKSTDSDPVSIEPIKTQKVKSGASLDAIEMKMNELHGIPFIERPPHELPKVYNRDIKTYSKTESKSTSQKGSKLPNLVPFSNMAPQKSDNEAVIDLDSEEEVIEHEPITGDIDLNSKNIIPKQTSDTKTAKSISDASQKEAIITENDFDKFARRNSITYENCLTVNFEGNNHHNVIQGLVEKDSLMIKTPKNETTPTESKTKSVKQNTTKQSNNLSNQIKVTSKLMPVNEEMLNKNYQSKLQLAYQTALTAKRQVEPPITIIEDKPVKVVFMESTAHIAPCQLNIQGQSLSPAKKQVLEKDSFTTSPTGDSLDSDVLDAPNDEKNPQDKVKTKHQRKQVLTPVEAPELELIVPADLGVGFSPKKKRRTDDYKIDKSAKTLVPKKTYLLGRSVNVEESTPQDLTKASLIQPNPTIIPKVTSALDNLVKAAELIETQSESLIVSQSESLNATQSDSLNSNSANSDVSQQATPVKRGRGRPRKYPLPEGTPNKAQVPSPQKKPRLIDAKKKQHVSTDEDTSTDDEMIKENWTMGKINENIVCPICGKLFRSENVVFKHVKHCTGPSPNRSDSDKRSLRKSRFSRGSDSKSFDEQSDDTDRDSDNAVLKTYTPKKRISKDSGADDKDDVIVIEDTPVKDKVEKTNVNKQQETKKPVKTKAQYKASTLSCEHCGKTFRQLSYLVNHKLLHKKENAKALENNEQVEDKTVFSCEVCKKEFRKLHHLVQHRIIHNPQSVSTRPSRKTSSEQHADIKVAKEQEPKSGEDHSAAFRCEPCDKSFRKLHHLVEHRETHDGINRQKTTTTTPTVAEKVVNEPPPQCNVCNKTFRKLHHLIEHKEQHLETSSEKSDDKSVKSSLSTKDIIHECPLCYMVFPNEHSLNKHSVFCQRKKRQSALKQAAKQSEIIENVENEEIATDIEKKVDPSPIEAKITEPENEPKIDENSKSLTDEKNKDQTVIQAKELPKKEESKPLSIPKKRELQDISDPVVKEKPQKVKKVEDKPIQVSKAEKPKPKVTVKDKEVVSVAKRRQSNLPLATIKESAPVESSDDDEIRYMLNPNFVEENNEGKVFMKVRAQKRNSLQFERPTYKDLVKRRTSLQHPPKIPRLKAKAVPITIDTSSKPILVPSKLEPVSSTDSDDSDVKYSFPEKAPETTDVKKTPKEKRKSIAEKKKVLGAIARRKSLGKAVAVKQKGKSSASPEKQVKRRRAEVEHRCDCGQLFNSAALLSRHTSLAHTPPRLNRRRASSPPAPPAPAAPANKPVDSRKSSARSDGTAPAKPGRPAKTTRTPTRRSVKPEQADTVVKSSALKGRKTPAHRGVPVPEKMKKIMAKLKK